jgi:ketosteroid isomerase-like protein
MTTTEGNRELIRTAFGAWEAGDSRPFFRLVADDVRWTVIGTTAISGTYASKADFMAGASGPLFAKLAEPIRATVRDVLADGDQVVLRWEGASRGTNGHPYAQTYCWVMRLAEGTVVEVTAYLDTELVAAVLSGPDGG